MFTITKEFTFDAAHHLPHLPEGHKCRRPHGHTYVVIVELQSPLLDENKFVEDYGKLDDIKQYINDHLDHRDLNEVFPNMYTTAEMLAVALFNQWRNLHPKLTAVTVKETTKTAATFRVS